MCRTSTSTSTGRKAGDARLCSGPGDWAGWKCCCRHQPRCSLILLPHGPHDARWYACCCAHRASCRHTKPPCLWRARCGQHSTFPETGGSRSADQAVISELISNIKVGDLTTDSATCTIALSRDRSRAARRMRTGRIGSLYSSPCVIRLLSAKSPTTGSL